MNIEINNLTHEYASGTENKEKALDNVSLLIPENKFTAIVGETGSGKSTLIRHLNGLLKPTEGTINIDGYTIDPETKEDKLAEIRKHVGIVFQFPENQLFAKTVLEDVAFGPINFGMEHDKAIEIAEETLENLHFDSALYSSSPLELSGGQMQRVALAGVIATNPDVLILDEPTAGLDPIGKKQVMGEAKKIQETTDTTVIMVTHSMEDVATYADYVVAMGHGKLKYSGNKSMFFQDEKLIHEAGLKLPKITAFTKKFLIHGQRKDLLEKNNLPATIDQFEEYFKNYYDTRKGEL